MVYIYCYSVIINTTSDRDVKVESVSAKLFERAQKLRTKFGF